MTNLNITSPAFGPITLVQQLPSTYNGQILPGSKIYSTVQEFGMILLQELKTEDFIIRYNFFHFIQKITLTVKEENQGVQALMALKNDLRQKIKFIGDVHLREGQYTPFYSPFTEIKTAFKKQIPYQSFHAAYSPYLLQQLVPAFPFLNTIVNATANTAFSIGKPAQWAQPQMTEIVNNILHCPYQHDLRRFYFENKLKEFLFLLLIQSSKKDPDRSSPTNHEIDAVHEARKIILNDLEKHLPIPDISKKVQLNEFKLKTVFKQVFGLGMFETLLHARMQKARSLLLETDKPIKEIASIIGYERITSFITAFRKHFGYTPASLRRK
jgi:AraC-like DNA-binding protein